MSGERRSTTRDEAGVLFIGLLVTLMVNTQLDGQPFWLRLASCVGAGVGAALIVVAVAALWRRRRR